MPSPAVLSPFIDPPSFSRRRTTRWCSVVLLSAVLVSACSVPPESQIKREDILVLTKRMIVLNEAGRYEEALPVAQRAVQHAEETLGPEHPTVAIYLTYLGGVYRSLGRVDEAQGTYQRALAMQEKLLGADHVAVSNTLSAVAGLQQDHGMEADAERSLRRALAIRERAFGPGHAATVTVISKLGRL